jgi:hypothetical protein
MNYRCAPSKAEFTLLGIARTTPQRTCLSEDGGLRPSPQERRRSSLTVNGRGGEAGDSKQ